MKTRKKKVIYLFLLCFLCLFMLGTSTFTQKSRHANAEQSINEKQAQESLNQLIQEQLNSLDLKALEEYLDYKYDLTPLFVHRLIKIKILKYLRRNRKNALPGWQCIFSYSSAMASISHSTPLGSSRTATQLRAGLEVKYLA